MTSSTSSENPLSATGSWPAAQNSFAFGQRYDLVVYLHDQLLLPEPNNLTPFWILQGLEYGNWSEGDNQVNGPYIVYKHVV